MAQTPDLTPVNSAAISGYHYDPSSRDLTVQFTSGATYRYADVPMEKAEAMAGNKSIGGYFMSRIRDQHAATKL